MGSFVTVYSIHHVINTRLCAMYWSTATRVTAHACAYAATRTRNRFDHDAVYSAYPMLTRTQVPGDEDRVCGRDLDLRSGLSIGSRQHHFDCWLAVFPSSLVEVTINRVAPLVPSYGRRVATVVWHSHKSGVSQGDALMLPSTVRTRGWASDSGWRVRRARLSHVVQATWAVGGVSAPPCVQVDAAPSNDIRRGVCAVLFGTSRCSPAPAIAKLWMRAAKSVAA